MRRCRAWCEHFSGSAVAGYLLLATALLASASPSRSATAADRPNVLWLTSEDNGPHLGCYGDDYATTPHLDRLAAQGMRYTNAWSTAPVCAPARTVILTGMWAPSLGAEHMRSLVRLPEHIKPYPQHLREAGYYCTNNSKTDYNVAVNMRAAWDESSAKAHWKHRANGQPFFAVFNLTITHESQIRNPLAAKDRLHDPAKVRVPAYHPDTTEVRKDWAQYYDRLTMMDRQCGQALSELSEAGLDDDTIVFYYGDHGPGMPRSKRWPYNSGLHVPLIVYVPPKWRHLAPPGYQVGRSSDRLVSFYDLAPTLLNVCGVQPPEHMHGQPFMGDKERLAAEPEFAFGFRGRMDERYDLVRVARDKRYVYTRNFMPHKIYGQHIDYMFQTPTTRVWKELFDDGKLTKSQSRFWETKPSEELYDLQADTDEVNNLATSAEHAEVVRRMREKLSQQLVAWRDVGFLPEGEIHARSGDDSPWTMAQDDTRCPLARIVGMAELATSSAQEVTPALVEGLSDSDSAVRYWAIMGFLVRGARGVAHGTSALRAALDDDCPAVRVIAAEALGKYGNAADVEAARKLLIEHSDLNQRDTFTAMLALNALHAMGTDKVSPRMDQIAALPMKVKGMPARADEYVARLLEKFRADLTGKPASGGLQSNQPTPQ